MILGCLMHSLDCVEVNSYIRSVCCVWWELEIVTCVSLALLGGGGGLTLVLVDQPLELTVL